jgi:phosphoribosylamine--glycine ligase
VLVVGGGGREHALCQAFRSAAEVFCTPGNAGTDDDATNLKVSASDEDALLDAVSSHRIDLTVVGPEAPLADGLTDRLEAAGHRAFGPSARAARIEASKAFAKRIMADAGVKTAAARVFTSAAPALAYIDAHAEPLVVKASGLAGGKGAVVCDSRADASAAAREMFAGRFGDAGQEVVVEDFLEGEELSVFALTDGEQCCLLPASQDHKRIGEGDTGPNTGGMGASTPVSIATPELMARVERDVILPTLTELARTGARYRGVLYAGLMIPESGEPAVVEFNCRFGDPEAQVVLPVVGGDLLDLLWRIAAGEAWTPVPPTAMQAAVTTVLAAAGYPEAPVRGAAIEVPDTIPEDTFLFHAGTSRDGDGTLRVSGGRVFAATGFGPDVAAAAAASRRLADVVAFEGKQYRRDIAWREITRAAADLSEA